MSELTRADIEAKVKEIIQHLYSWRTSRRHYHCRWSSCLRWRTR